MCVQWIVMRKNSYNNDSDLRSELKLFGQLRQFCATFYTLAFIMNKNQGGIPGNRVDTSRTNEINAEKNCFVFDS